jgi:tetratricopeptide (TPR) repeat protein
VIHSSKAEKVSSGPAGEPQPREAPRRRRRIFWVLLLLVVLSASGAVAFLGWQEGWWNRLLHFTDRRTVQVLPFEVQGQEEGGDLLGKAFAQTLAMNLSVSRDLQVLRVPESMKRRSLGALALDRDAQSLGAGRLLTGRLRRRDKIIEAEVSLTDTATHQILWSARGRGEDDSLTSLATSFAAEALARMEVPPLKLYDYPRNFTGSGRLAGSSDFRAALEAVRHNDHGVALEATQRLVARFPEEAEAHALRAYELFQARGSGATSPEELEAELRALEKLDPSHATAKNLRCEILLNDAAQLTSALACATELLGRNDLTPAARAWPLRDRAAAKLKLHDTAGALKDIGDAATLDPTNSFTFTILGDIQKNMGDLPGAAASLRQSLALVPESDYAIWSLADLLDRQGKPEEATKLAETLCVQFPTPCHCAYEARLLLKAGRRVEALAAARRGNASAAHDGSEDMCLAAFWAVAGEESEAIGSLQRALAALPAGQLADLDNDPDFASLRGLPQFEAILTKARSQSGGSRNATR